MNLWGGWERRVEEVRSRHDDVKWLGRAIVLIPRPEPLNDGRFKSTAKKL